MMGIPCLGHGLHNYYGNLKPRGPVYKWAPKPGQHPKIIITETRGLHHFLLSIINTNVKCLFVFWFTYDVWVWINDWLKTKHWSLLIYQVKSTGHWLSLIKIKCNNSVNIFFPFNIQNSTSLKDKKKTRKHTTNKQIHSFSARYRPIQHSIKFWYIFVVLKKEQYGQIR